MTAILKPHGMSISIVVCCCWMVGCGSKDVEQVKAAWDGYAAAILASDGPRAAMHVSASTKDYYERLRLATVQGSPDEIARMPFADRLTVGVMRIKMDIAYLKTLNGEQTLMVGVQQGLIDAESANASSISDIQVEGDTATAAYFVHDQRVPFRIRMVKEDGQWKLDLPSILEGSAAVLPAALRKQFNAPGMTDDQVILTVLSAMSGSQVGPEIWAQPKP